MNRFNVISSLLIHKSGRSVLFYPQNELFTGNALRSIGDDNRRDTVMRFGRLHLWRYVNVGESTCIAIKGDNTAQMAEAVEIARQHLVRLLRATQNHQ